MEKFAKSKPKAQRVKNDSPVVRFEEPSKGEEAGESGHQQDQQLDCLLPSDDVSEIYKVYWSRKHDQIVAKVKVKRSERRGGKRQYADILTKIPVRQLKDRKASLFIDFMSELIKDEIRRQKSKRN